MYQLDSLDGRLTSRTFAPPFRGGIGNDQQSKLSRATKGSRRTLSFAPNVTGINSTRPTFYYLPDSRKDFPDRLGSGSLKLTERGKWPAAFTE